MMSRRFYFSAIYFTGLYLIAVLFEGILSFRLAEQAYAVPSFAGWFVFWYILFLIYGLFLLVYYQSKKYHLTLWAGILSIFASFLYVIVVYDILKAGELRKFYPTIYFLTIGTGMLHAISLIFSNSRERPWLKRTGILILLIELVLLFTSIWHIDPGNAGGIVAIRRVRLWTGVAGVLIPLLYIMNYWSEWRSLPTKKLYRPTGQRTGNVLLAVTGTVALIAMLVWGSKFAMERPDAAGDLSRITEETKRLAEPFEARTYVGDSGDTLRYRLMMPVDYNPKSKYPLVVCLHHGGAHGTDNILQIDGSGAAQLLSMDWARHAYPAIIFAPQCPAATNCPNMFAAAIPVCGAGDPALAKNIIHVPVWAFQGEDDRNVPAKLQRDMIAALRKAGGHPRYTEFPGEGHNIWTHVSQAPGLLDWLFAQNRVRQPQ